MDKLSVNDPECVVHLNLESDFNSLGILFSDVYMAYLSATPDVPPIPIDFTRFFGHFGFTSMQSATWVSETRSGGGFSNQSLLEFDGPPKGIFLLTGETNSSFPVIRSAPANADIVGEFNFNGLALYGIVRDVVIEIMGPMGQGIIDAQMNQPLAEDGPTLADVINRLTTRIQIAMQFGPPPLEGVTITFNELIQRGAVRINNVADLLERFAPMLEASGLTRLEDQPGSWLLEIDNPELYLSVYIQGIEGTNDLLLSLSETDKAWFLDSEAKLKDSPEFLSMVKGLPLKGTSFWYATRKASEFQIETMNADIESNPQTDAVFVALKNFLKRYTGSQIGVSYIEGNSIRSMAYQPGSFKTNMATAAILVPAGVLASVMPIIQENMASKAAAKETPTDPASPPE